MHPSISKHKCLYCGFDCPLAPTDTKHPDRWKVAYLASTTEHFCKTRSITISQKQHIQETCQLRKDDWGDQVFLRSQSITDVVAKDVRYHAECLRNFFLKTSNEKQEAIEDRAFLNVLRTVNADKSVFWNGVELYHLYTSNNDDVKMEKKSLHYEAA